MTFLLGNSIMVTSPTEEFAVGNQNVSLHISIKASKGNLLHLIQLLIAVCTFSVAHLDEHWDLSVQLFSYSFAVTYTNGSKEMSITMIQSMNTPLAQAAMASRKHSEVRVVPRDLKGKSKGNCCDAHYNKNLFITSVS